MSLRCHTIKSHDYTHRASRSAAPQSPDDDTRRQRSLDDDTHGQRALDDDTRRRCDERLRGGLGSEAKESPSLSPAKMSRSQIRSARMSLAVSACLKAPQTQTDLWKRLSIASVFLLMFVMPATI